VEGREKSGAGIPSFKIGMTSSLLIKTPIEISSGED
jgi:hypothetical protein